MMFQEPDMVVLPFHTRPLVGQFRVEMLEMLIEVLDTLRERHDRGAAGEA
jgi:hypothetical protein